MFYFIILLLKFMLDYFTFFNFYASVYCKFYQILASTPRADFKLKKTNFKIAVEIKIFSKLSIKSNINATGENHVSLKPLTYRSMKIYM